MNVIEQTVEPKNGAIDLHVDVPAEWEGYVLKVTVERTEAKVDKPKKTGMSRFDGKWAHLPLEDRLTMQKQVDDLRDEWERPIFLDTSACSKYIQGLLSRDAADLMNDAVESESIMSVVTRIELLSWITGQTLLDEDVRQFIKESTILPLSEEIIGQTVRLRRHYKSVKLPDAIIAATAMVNDFTLLSANDRDFKKIAGLKYKSLSR